MTGQELNDYAEPISTDLRSFAFICGKKEFPTKEPNRCYQHFGTALLSRISALCESWPPRYPEGLQIEAYGLERRGNHLVGIGKTAGLDPNAGLESVGLQHTLDRIDQPGWLHPVMGVQRQLNVTVFALGGRRQDLAHPVWNDLEALIFRGIRHALTSPSGPVRNQDLEISHQVELWFI